MTDTTKALLEKLAEIAPERFECNKDEEYQGECWNFHDKKLGHTVDAERPPSRWLLEMLNKTKIDGIYRHEYRTWEESILERVYDYFRDGGK